MTTALGKTITAVLAYSLAAHMLTDLQIVIRDKKENAAADGDALKLAANNLRLTPSPFPSMTPDSLPLSQSKANLQAQLSQQPRAAQPSQAAITPGTINFIDSLALEVLVKHTWLPNAAASTSHRLVVAFKI